jgi:drug/metabolite transporter (DMT)-like permease
MLKAFTPVSTMAAGFLFGLEQPSAKLMAAVGCISAGVLVSSYGELNFSVFGVAAMMASIAAEGLRTALMQHLLASKQFHPLEAWLYLGPACLIWLTVLVGVSEAQQIHDTQALSILAAHPWHCAFAALAGFAVNALAMSVIHLASALTLKVLGVCKDVGLVAFGVLLLGEHIGDLQVCGYALALCGFTAYNVIKLTSPPAPQAADLSRQSAGGKDSKDAAQQFSHSHSSHSSRQLAQQQHSGLTAMYCSVVRGEAPSLGRSSLTEPLLAPALHP